MCKEMKEKMDEGERKQDGNRQELKGMFTVAHHVAGTVFNALDVSPAILLSFPSAVRVILVLQMRKKGLKETK